MQIFTTRLRGIITAALLIAAPMAQAATPSTSTGQISVAQLMDMLSGAAGKPMVRQLLTAYLGGVGESAGYLVSATAPDGKHYASCKSPLHIDPARLPDVLHAAAPDEARWTETAATPIVVADMLAQAGCR